MLKENILVKQRLNLFLEILSAFLICSIALYFALSFSNLYFSNALFHYDSASYLYSALHFHDLLLDNGKLSAIVRAFKCQDGMDIVLRIIFAPDFLLTQYGHLVILLPFMCLFLFLMIHYIRARISSLWTTLLAVCIIFSSPIIYNPYTGIADFWKESIAIWIMGGAIVSWLLADNLKYRGWSFLSGLLLGCLVWERTALAVYMAPPFVPLIIYTLYVNTKKYGVKHTFNALHYFAIPALILTAFVAVFQWKALYHYYIEAGYSYAVSNEVYRSLFNSINLSILSPEILLLLIISASIFCIGNWRVQLKDILIMLWFVICYPVSIVLMHTLYHHTQYVWSMLLFILMAAALPVDLKKFEGNFKFKLFHAYLVALIIAFSVHQYHFIKIEMLEFAKGGLPIKKLYEDELSILLGLPKPYHVAILYQESDALFYVYLRLKHRVQIPTKNDLMIHEEIYAHDRFYRKKDDEPLKPFIESTINEKKNSLEKIPNMIAFTFCDPKMAGKNLMMSEDRHEIAIPVARGVTEKMLGDSRWQKIAKLDSPMGCLYALKFQQQ